VLLRPNKNCGTFHSEPIRAKNTANTLCRELLAANPLCIGHFFILLLQQKFGFCNDILYDFLRQRGGDLPLQTSVYKIKIKF
jgi:hypothetical protein